MKYINRLITDKIKDLSRSFPVITLTGPRQSGKTTLLKKVFPGYRYVNMEDPEQRILFTADPRGFFRNYNDHVVFDEVQRVPDIFSYIQLYTDEKPEPGKFILSGSQSFLLSEKISQSLAGRTAVLSLLPLSINELDDSGSLPADFEEVAYTGFYPALYSEAMKAADFYPAYLQTYVERDIRLIRNIGNLDDFVRFTKLCAGRTGQLLNLSSLASDCGISVNTAKEWISALQASYVIFLLQPYYKNFNKRIVKMPKLYFFDNGLLSSLLGIDNAQQIAVHYIKGQLFENLIISEFYKWFTNAGKKPGLYFWRENHGNEIDCIVEWGNKRLSVEIKAGYSYNAEYFSHLITWQKYSGAKPDDSFVVYSGDFEGEMENGRLVNWKNMNVIREEFS